MTDKHCRWAGWGRETDALKLSDRPKLQAYLAETLGGLPPRAEEPPPLESIDAAPSRLSETQLAAVVEIVGDEQVRRDNASRLKFSLGKSYPDLIRARSGRIEPVTDAVVSPADEAQVAAVVEVAARRHLAVVPFGGGTSVVGGVDPRMGSQQAVITLDLSRLNELRIDENSLLIDVGAGAFGPDIEATLSTADLTLGHFPQSFEFSTIGGWVATRGAGQNSTRYGKIEDLVQAVRIVTPQGRIETRNVPASATGPSVLQAMIGSEGTLGVITSVIARVRRRAEATAWRAFLVGDFEVGCRLLRALEQAELPLAVVRLSDAEETRWMSKASEGRPSLVTRLGKWYVQQTMRRRGFESAEVCFLLASFEGSKPTVRLAAAQAQRIAKRFGAIGLGSSPGKGWQQDRFRLPYLRDELIARRLMVDTLETATTWSNLGSLYESVRETLARSMRESGAAGVVMCHVSHLYSSGASLYFTYMAPQVQGQELSQWHTVKQATTSAIVAGGGAISHHHGIGQDHLPLEAEDGPLAVAAMVAAKERLDPDGIMNPGKLFGRPGPE